MLERLREDVKSTLLVISAHVFISWLIHCTAVGPAWSRVSWLQVHVVEQHCPHHDMQEAEKVGRGFSKLPTSGRHPACSVPGY